MISSVFSLSELSTDLKNTYFHFYVHFYIFSFTYIYIRMHITYNITQILYITELHFFFEILDF